MCKSPSRTYPKHNDSVAFLPSQDVDSSPTLHATPNLNYSSSSNLIEENDTEENPVINEESVSSLLSSFHLLVKQSERTNFEVAMKLFCRFQVTFWGGSHTKTSVNVDCANLTMILNNIGAENFFKVDNLNDYFTYELNSGKATITLLGKIKSIQRSIKCMK